MTNKDILHYVRLKTDIVDLINRYISEYGIPATIQRSVFDEVSRALNEASDTEIQEATAEEEAEKQTAEDNTCESCQIEEE